MGLAIRDCEVGTIVDHSLERGEDDVIRSREIIRRGIIVKVIGNKQDSIQQLMVQFSKDGKPEDVKAVELVRVFPSNDRRAKEAYRRLIGAPLHVGATFTSRRGVTRQVIQDELALTPNAKEGAIAPEFDETADASGMGLSDSQP